MMRLVLPFFLTCYALAAAEPRLLTLREAHEIALKNNPQISASAYLASAANEVTKQNRSGFFPTITANATSVGTTDPNTRIAAGSLSNPAIFERNSEGIAVSQLITDFGRTANLTSSAKLRALAAGKNHEATQFQTLMSVDVAFFGVLQAQAVMNVSTQTVATRELLLNQVSTLASNGLKSELDVTFARVTLDEGKLLFLRSQNDLEASMARLSALLGDPAQPSYSLLDEPMMTNAPSDISVLVREALESRPELVRARLERDAALKFAKAEHALHYPVISAIGGVGVIPIRDPQFRDSYAAAGVNLSLPLFVGGLYTAKAREAALRAKAAEELLRGEEDNVIRDVRTAWLSANSASERLSVTEKLLEHAVQAFELAQARYQLGGASMVELSQAQLNETAAQITRASARYDFQLQRALLAFQTGKSL